MTHKEYAESLINHLKDRGGKEAAKAWVYGVCEIIINGDPLMSYQDWVLGYTSWSIEADSLIYSGKLVEYVKRRLPPEWGWEELRDHVRAQTLDYWMGAE